MKGWIALLVLVLAAAIADAALTMAGVLAPLNLTLTLDAYRFEPGWLTPAMVGLTLLGEDPPLDAFALVLALWAYRLRRRWLALTMVGVAVAARALAVGIKYLVREPRPFLHGPPPHPLTVLHGYGYPSGHAFLSMAVLGFGALAISTLLASAPRRRLAGLICVLLILGIGWSRVYLGFHWVNDVVGGYLDGATVGLAGWTVQQRLRTRWGQLA
jgi:undecaprenyl-diphosphatase